MALSSDQAKAMFGCDMSDLEEMVSEMLGSPLMLVAAIMSDAQEELARGNAERARQYLNRAKWLQFKIMDVLEKKEVFIKRDELKGV